VSRFLNRKTGIAIFLALLAVVLLGYVFFPRGESFRSGALIPKNKAAHIERIEIAQNGYPYEVVLERRNALWKLAIDTGHAFPARPAKIESLMAALSSDRPIVSVGAVSEEKIGIGNEGSYSVRVFTAADTAPALFLFGTTDTAGKWLYVKRATDNRIFRTASDLTAFLDVRAASWATLDIFSARLAQTGIQRITLTKNGIVRYFLAGKDAEVSNFEYALAHLECQDVTNLRPNATESITVEFGDLLTTEISLAPLGDVWILSDSVTGAPYIISDTTKRSLDAALGEGN
jgi:hypothetical protein